MNKPYNYEELAERESAFDPIIQEQIDSYIGAMRRATNSNCCIGICETPRSMQVSVHTAGANRIDAEANALVMLVQAAAGAMEQASDGHMKLMVQIGDELLPAKADDLRTHMGVRP